MINKKRYREFCKEEVSIPIFSQSWWLDSVCGVDNWNVIIIENNGNIMATMPIYFKKINSFNVITMPKLTQNMGIYIKYPKSQKYSSKLSFEKKIINSIIEQLPKVDRFSQNFHYSFNNWLPFFWSGFIQSTNYTYVIENLQLYSLDDILQNFSSSYRNKIKKAKKLVNIGFDLDIKSFYDINMKTFDRQGVKRPYSLDFLISHDSVLEDNKSKKIFYAFDTTDQIHSALYLTWDHTSSYVHMVGEDPNLRNSGAGILLILEAIKYTKEVLKLNIFDFEGSMLENVEQVRRDCGGIQKPYFIISKTNSKLLVLKNAIKKIIK
jgi:hypothetical protein